MTKNLSLRIQYTIFACLLWAGLSKSTQAQMLSLDYSVDTNCILTVSLLDSNSTIASFNPPYHFSVGGINVNSNSLGSAIIDISSLPNSTYTIEVIDGNQDYYSGTASIICGQTTISPSFSLVDSLYQNPSNCSQCNGAGYITVTNPNGGLYTFEWSDGVVGVDTSQDTRTDLCTGIYTVVVTDSFGNKNATSITVLCNNALNPQVATCFPNITRYLGLNNQVNINANSLSSIAINNNQTQAYIIDPTGAISSNISFNCNDLGYHNLSLLLIDSIQQVSDTCNVLVHIQDSLGTCNGLIANANSLVGNTTDASNCSTCDGSYTFIRFLDSLTATGASNFVWSDGSTAGPTRTDLCPNQNYTLSVSDANGTIHTATINANCLGSLCLDSNLVDSALLCPPVYAPVCGCDNVTYMNACLAAYTYGVSTWTQGVCGANGLSLNISTNPDASCDSIVIGCSGSANIIASGGLAPYSITWSDTSIIGFSPTNICPGNYTIIVNDFAGSTTTSIITIGISGCVWPGDTDDNTVANNLDLLPIGLAYGDTGPARPQVSNTWTPTFATDWSNNPIVSLPNQKHFDANGDGTIDSLDVDVISLNYGRSYFRSNTQSLAGITPFGINNVAVYIGDTISTPIYLGNVFYPVTDAYALAFTINYNPDHIEAGSVNVDFDNSWLGTDLLHIQKDFNRVGQIEVAVSRKDKMPISGFGPIGTMHFTIKDDLIMGRLSNTDSIISAVSISAVRFIDHQNIELGTTPLTGNIVISELLSINSINNNKLEIQLFPNPTDGLLNIISKKATITSIQLFNATGQLIDSNSTPDLHENKISMERLATGIYFLSVQTDQGVFNQKIQVIH
jgi:hypothetical protein